MEVYILFGIIVFSLSYNFEPSKAVDYSKTYYSKYDRELSLDSFSIRDGRGSDFVTDCLIAGGFDKSNWMTDNKGSI